MDVTKLTVPQLKEELKKHNLKITGTKQELTARLLEFTKESAPVVAPAPILAPLTAPVSAPILSPSLPIPAQVQGPLKPHVPVTLAGPNVTIPSKPVLAPSGPSGPATTASSSVSTASAGKYAGMTVNQLKEELKAKGLKVSGTKAELIDRLTGSEGISVETRQPIVPTMPGAVSGGPAVIPAPASPAGPSSSSSSPAVSAAEYGKMTVAQLREELRDLELKVSGTKPELIQRLMDYQSGKIISTGRRSSPAGSPASFAALGFKFVPKGEGEEESSEDEDIPEVPEGESSEEDPASDKEEEEEEPVSDDE